MSGSRVIVRVRGLRSDTGVVLVALFPSADGFPTHPERARHHGAAPIADRTAEVTFDAVEPGTWAAAVLHDEDIDFEMDRTKLGLPREGLGLSGNREWRVGMPSFEASAFEVRAGEDARIEVRARYFLSGLLGG